MPGKSLTNKPVSEEMKESSYMIVSQDEDVNGETKQALRKIPVSVLSKYLGVDELKKLTDLIPLGNGDAYSIGYEEKISASLMDTAGSYIAVDNEYAFCAYYSNVGSYVGETVYVSGACSQTYPLYVFKDVDGIVIDMGWGAGSEELTVVEDYAVTVPEDAETMYINQLRGYEFSPCARGYFPKMEVGEENLAEDVVEKINSAAVKTEVHSAFSNALKGSASGAIVALDDVSPVGHEVNCTVKSKNLLRYPYYQTTKTQHGITFTDNGDGSITINGMATDNASLCIAHTSAPLKLKKGMVITGKAIDTAANGVSFAMQKVIDGNLSGVAMSLSYVNTTITTDCEDYYVYLYIRNGTTVNNMTVYPQLEEGTESTDWAPYVAPESVALSRYGKNLSQTSGFTLTTDSEVNYAKNLIVYLPAGKYVLSTKFKQAGELNKVGIAVRNMNYENLGGVNITSDTQSGALSYPFEVPVAQKCRLQFWGTYGSANVPTGTVKSIFSDIQLEVDNGSGEATEYEPYELTTYTPGADGTVEGVISLAPNMTLMTDTAGAIVECKYNRDINKAFEEMYNAIISLGGSI